jgi:hypothetical protein
MMPRMASPHLTRSGLKNRDPGLTTSALRASPSFQGGDEAGAEGVITDFTCARPAVNGGRP